MILKLNFSHLWRTKFHRKELRFCGPSIVQEFFHSLQWRQIVAKLMQSTPYMDDHVRILRNFYSICRTRVEAGLACLFIILMWSTDKCFTFRLELEQNKLILCKKKIYDSTDQSNKNTEIQKGKITSKIAARDGLILEWDLGSKQKWCQRYQLGWCSYNSGNGN